MNGLRLLMVTRRFWPMSGPSEMAVSDLACGFKALGHHVDIVTLRFEKFWPARALIREIPVFRISRSIAGPWSTFRYLRALGRFLDQQMEEVGEYDGIIIFGLGPESESIHRHLHVRRVGSSVVTRVDPGCNSYRSWSGTSIQKAIQSLHGSLAVAADSELTRDRLVRYGVDRSKLHVVPDGAVFESDEFAPRTRAKKIAARRALSDAHPILAVDPETPLVVSAAPMHDDNGLVDLVSAWPKVVETFPSAKLWLLGDGPTGQAVWDAIKSNSLVHSVVMPGFFDDLQQVFSAADLYVHPCRTDIGSSNLPRAMAEGLCPVSTLGAFADQYVRKDETGIVTVPGNANALAEAIIHGLLNGELRQRLGSSSRSLVLKKLGVVEQARTFVKLLTNQIDPVVQTAK